MKKLNLLFIIFFIIFFSSCYKEDINSLKKQIVTLQTRIDSLSTVLNVNTSILQRRADSLSSALNVTNSNLNQTNQSINSASKSIDSVRTQLLLISNQISIINKQLQTDNTNIAAATNQIESLNKQYAELASRLNSLVQTSFIYTLRLNWNSFDTSASVVYIMDSTKWHYVAVTIDNSREVKVYVDGVLGSNFYRTNVGYSYSSLFIGSSFYTSFTQYFKGAIDELRISNIVRTQKEIQDYYNLSIGGAPNFPNNGTPTPTQTLDNSTLGLFNFNETSGTTYANSVSNKPSGVLFGNYSFIKGISGNAIYFDGKTGRGDCKMSLVSSPLTFEFWFKTNTLSPNSSIIQPYGLYNSDIFLSLR
jgi:hypothetical protein